MAVAFRTIGLEYGQDVMLKTDIGVADPPGYWQDIWTMAAGIYGDNTGYAQQQTGKHTDLFRNVHLYFLITYWFTTRNVCDYCL